ncbi:type II toxin-antitoxin system PemK/MazF family toxin [Agromyces sp. LHK192]|uniref:type II toxin-antitoxin system PemK/MazF family toxin n=1 Tax=Agromyces sp. LHK192 TaxID=2498704 RepID=UPI001F0B79F3|nr:type II toxin-antitoxin system PemK/MazF family toxin [Agromyces sp. LHK192]
MSRSHRLLNALTSLVRTVARGGTSRVHSGQQPPTTDAAPSGRSDAAPSPGRSGSAATTELDPRRIGAVRFAYRPERDGEPDPGEIVWTWVPFEERDGRGKDRPVAIVAAGADGEFLAVQLTSKGRDDDHDLVPLGAGPWDAQGRPSWARIDRVFRVSTAGMRREGATLDAARFEALTHALGARYGWRSA